MNQLALPERIEIVETDDASCIDSNISKLKSTIDMCGDDLIKISELMKIIQAQGVWDNFFKKTENIKTVANGVNDLANIQKRIMDLIILLLSVSGGLGKRYIEILDSIDGLAQMHSGNVDMLDYLVKIKKMINEMKERSDLLETLVINYNGLRDSLVLFDTQINDISADMTSCNSNINNLLASYLTQKEQIDLLIKEKNRMFKSIKQIIIYLCISVGILVIISLLGVIR